MALYLVTGGCGFIGSHLVEALIARGDDVRILDDLSTGSLDNLPRGPTVLRGSVAQPSVVDAAMDGIIGCFHLAAVTSVEKSIQSWFSTNRTNLAGTIAVFDAARRLLPRVPVVYASSAAVYGSSRLLPNRETDPVRPCSPYGADKYGSEVHARIASELHNVQNVGLRFFNVYGPRQDPASSYSGVISKFCHGISTHHKFEIFGDGLQTRDFVYVKDVVRSLIAAMDRAGALPPVMNICSGQRTSVLNLARTIAELCCCEPEICFQASRAGEVTDSVGDPSLMRRHLGIDNLTDLRSGLKQTLASIQESTI